MAYYVGYKPIVPSSILALPKMGTFLLYAASPSNVNVVSYLGKAIKPWNTTWTFRRT